MKKLLSLGLMLALFNIMTVVANAESIIIPMPAGIPPGITIGNVISAVVGFLLILSAIAAFLFLILGGLQWITSGGDKAGMEAARNKITAAIVGLIIVAASWAVMMLVGQFIGVNLLDPAGLKIPTIQFPKGQ